MPPGRINIQVNLTVDNITSKYQKDSCKDCDKSFRIIHYLF